MTKRISVFLVLFSTILSGIVFQDVFAARNIQSNRETGIKSLYFEDFSGDISNWNVVCENGANWIVENECLTSGPVDTWNAEQETIIILDKAVQEDEYAVSFDATESRYGGMASLVFGYESAERFYSLRMLNIDDVDYIGFYRRYDVSLWQEERLTLAKFPGGKREPSRTYTVKVSVSGNVLKGYINGILVTEYTVPEGTLTGNKCGIFQSYGHPSYDNFEISTNYVPDIEFNQNLKLMQSLGLMWDFGENIDCNDLLTNEQLEYFVSKLSNKPYVNDANSENASYEAVIESFLNVLGYDKLINTPSNYLVKQQLMNNTEGFGESVILKDFLQIAINSFDIDMVFPEYGRQSYYINKGVTVLNYYHDVHSDKSVLVGNGKTSIGNKNIGNYKFVSFEDGFKANIGDTNIDEYIGYEIRYYYKNSYEPEILYFELCPNSELFLCSDEIVSFEKGYINYKLKKEEKHKRIKISEDIVCIYNGVYEPDADVSEILPKSGDITIIDNGNADASDVIIVWDYTDILVETVSVGENKLYDKLSNTVIEFDSCDTWSILNESLEEISLTDINENYIVSAAFSKDKKTLTAIVNTTSKNVTVSEISLTDNSIIANGKSYSLADEFSLNSKISVGDSGTLYVNINDKVIYFEHAKSESLKPAYLIKTVPRDGLDERLLMCIFDGEIQELYCSEVVRINNNTYRKDNIYPQILNYCGIIEYKTNSKGEVSHIMFPKGYDIGQNDGDLIRMSSFTGSRVYKSDIHSFGGAFLADQNAKVFLVPYDRTRLSEYRLTDMSYFKNDINYYYLIAYSHGNNLEKAEIIESEFNDKPQYLLLGACILEDVFEEIDANGDYCKMITVRFDGNDVRTLALAEDCTFNDVQIGDILQYSVNIDGKVNEIVRIFDHMSGEFFHYGNAEFNASYRMIYGTVEEMRTSSFVFKYDGDKTEVVVPKCTVVVCDLDARGDKFRIGNVKDIRDEVHYGIDADKIMIRFEYGLPKEMIIYR